MIMEYDHFRRSNNSRSDLLVDVGDSSKDARVGSSDKDQLRLYADKLKSLVDVGSFLLWGFSCDLELGFASVFEYQFSSCIDEVILLI